MLNWTLFILIINRKFQQRVNQILMIPILLPREFKILYTFYDLKMHILKMY